MNETMKLLKFIADYLFRNLPLLVIQVIIALKVNYEIRLVIFAYMISRIFIAYFSPQTLQRFLRHHFSETDPQNKKLVNVKISVYVIEILFLLLSFWGTYRGINDVLGINEPFFTNLPSLNFALVYAFLITLSLFLIAYFIIEGKNVHYFVIVFLVVDFACVMPFNYLFFYEKIKQQYHLNIYQAGVIETETIVNRKLSLIIQRSINAQKTVFKKDSVDNIVTYIVRNDSLNIREKQKDYISSKNLQKDLSNEIRRRNDSLYRNRELIKIYIDAGENMKQINTIVVKHLKYQADFKLIDTSHIRYIEQARTLLLKTIDVCKLPDSLSNKIKTINDNKIDAIIALKTDIISKIGINEGKNPNQNIAKTTIDIWNNKVGDVRWLSLLFSLVIDFSPLILGILFSSFKKDLSNT